MREQQRYLVPKPYKFHDATRAGAVTTVGRWPDLVRRQRDDEIHRLRAEGLTHDQIGRVVGLSGRRVGQLLRAA